jgi:hypothetical protein
MDDLIIVFKVVGIFIYLVIGGIFWVTWMGMHNNTIDGNSFRLIYPFVIFDKAQFTERGNYWRVRHLMLYLIGVPISIALGILFNQ